MAKNGKLTREELQEGTVWVTRLFRKYVPRWLYDVDLHVEYVRETFENDLEIPKFLLVKAEEEEEVPNGENQADEA